MLKLYRKTDIFYGNVTKKKSIENFLALLVGKNTYHDVLITETYVSNFKGGFSLNWGKLE